MTSFDVAARESQDVPADVQSAVEEVALRAKTASRVLATATRSVKDGALEAIADALLDAEQRVLAANIEDLERGQAGGMSEGLLDRLRLTGSRLVGIADAMRFLASLPDPIGEVVRGSTLPNGLRMRQLRVPMGVVGMVYEARPNVTVDAAGLALKSGNAVVLRGGSAAARTNELIVEIIRGAVVDAGLPADLVQSIDQYGRPGVTALMRARGLVDVLVPRGGAGLIQSVVRDSIVPVIETGVGNCHIYVDASADREAAIAIVLNAKVQRPSVCNAVETVLVHRDLVASFVPDLLAALADAGVRVHGDDAIRAVASSGVGSASEQPFANVVAATDDDWAAEYHDLDLAMRVVDDVDAAIDHIRRWSSGHTEAILTQDLRASERFVAAVDSAAVMVNASTRFTDGGELGLGAEIGISTQKLHARGPMGLAELTTTKWVVHGDGHVRS